MIRDCFQPTEVINDKCCNQCEFYQYEPLSTNYMCMSIKSDLSGEFVKPTDYCDVWKQRDKNF